MKMRMLTALLVATVTALATSAPARAEEAAAVESVLVTARLRSEDAQSAPLA